MKPLLKIPRDLLLQALADLERPHPFAHERLGFFSFRQSMDSCRPFVLCYGYHPIPDEQYIPDVTCGARIGGAAIQTAMGRAFREQCGQLWVHTHGRRGHPLASMTDISEGPNVVRSLANAQPSKVQGWAIISEEGAWGQIRCPDGQLRNLDELTVIGWPLTIPSKDRAEVRRKRRFRFFAKRNNVDRYDRQSFLGSSAQRIFSRAKIAIVGLGGGGSHINQQLAHIGFQRVVLCDSDRVESTNLNRLIGATLRDARRRSSKTRVAKRLFKKLQPDAETNQALQNWESKTGELRDCDVIFGCLDSFRGRRDLEAFCRAHMIPLIDIGMV